MFVHGLADYEGAGCWPIFGGFQTAKQLFSRFKMAASIEHACNDKSLQVLISILSHIPLIPYVYNDAQGEGERPFLGVARLGCCVLLRNNE